MAAEVLLERGAAVTLYDAMPVVARKLIVAGRSKLSLTRVGSPAELVASYGGRADFLRPHLEHFSPDDLRRWAAGLGVETHAGSTGLVFPQTMTADDLLSRWLRRLRDSGLIVKTGLCWQGWSSDNRLVFCVENGATITTAASVVVLALGGGSWPQLGSTGAWVDILRQRGVRVQDLVPANCGFDADLSDTFRERFQGKPVKNVVLSTVDEDGSRVFRRGEFTITATGVEGGLFYHCGPLLRDRLAKGGGATVRIDLCPDRSEANLIQRLARPKGRRSLASHLRKTIGIDGVKAGLLREHSAPDDYADLQRLARTIKALPLRVLQTRPLAEAISSAGGVCFTEVDEQLMLHKLPGVFCAGEMLDWEAPTGGYLLTACFATGRAAGNGAADWLLGGA